jgi:hypothetical protein
MAKRAKWLPSNVGLFYIAVATLISIPILHEMHNFRMGIVVLAFIIGGAYAGDYGFRKSKITGKHR